VLFNLVEYPTISNIKGASMAKRYYQSAKSRSDESVGMKKRMGEYKDYAYKREGMINSDYSAMANMPQEVIMKDYPQVPYMYQGGYRDTVYGADWQMGADVMSKAVKKNGSRS
jgi:hypothetical protein